jgi:predicted SnoaL-like aldol condensation-catalyzing enzyme
VNEAGGEIHMTFDLETNKNNVAEFYDLIINKKDFESARKFMGDRYKQHNPLVADGPEGLKTFIHFLKTNYPEARSEIKKIIAEGNYVVLHVHSFRTPKTQRAIIEIFRLENGRIDEHWDVIQEIPEISANPNGMF